MNPFMKLKPFLWAMIILACLVQLTAGHLYGAYVLLFVGSAAAITLPELRRAGGFCGAPTLVATLPITHEDLSDQMVLLEPEDMVMTSALPKGGPAENTVYRAPVDKLDSPRLGGEVEHPVVNRANVKNRQANRSQLFGMIQHFRETYGSSLIAQQVSNPAGITDVNADSKYKSLVALKQKMELTFCSDQEQAEISGSVAGQTRGAVMWGRTAAQPNTTYIVPTAFRPLAAQNVSVAGVSSVTETLLRTMLKNLRIARQASVDVVGLCTLDFADVFDAFFLEQVPVAGSAIPTRHFNFDGGDDAFEMMITSYKTRFGRVTPYPTQYLNGTRSSAPLMTGDTTNGSPVINGMLVVPLQDDGSTSALQPFTLIQGTGIPAGAYIVSVDSATQVTISANATATGNDVALTLGQNTHCQFLDMKYWEVKTNLVPSHKPMPEDGGGEDAFVEAIASLFCTYPALCGSFYTV